MYSPGGIILIMCTQCTHPSTAETNTFYTQCILGVIIIIAMIKENDNYKVVLFCHLMFYCYLFLK